MFESPKQGWCEILYNFALLSTTDTLLKHGELDIFRTLRDRLCAYPYWKRKYFRKKLSTDDAEVELLLKDANLTAHIILWVEA